jgi:L-threonylcarbamoyladenylate synthase
VLEGAGSVEVEAKLRKSGLKGGWIGYGEFEFDLVCLHGVSIRLMRPSAAIGWRDMFTGKTERLEGEAGLLRAAELLRLGGTVAFPTETVYGLGANALDSTAVGRIFAAKERPGWDPVIVHVCDREMIKRVAEISASLTAKVEALMAAFWPGPLTLLLPRTSAVPDSVTAGRPLVGVRMPAHPGALELIRKAGVPVAAPSANRFGRISPTTAAHVLEDLDGRIDAVLDGGATSVGVESTVLDVEAMMIYRPGAITAEMVATVAGEVQVFQAKAVDLSSAPESLPSPGVGLRHYAPRARLVLVEAPTEDALAQAIEQCSQRGGMLGVMLPDGWDASNASQIYKWGSWGDSEVLARRLFAGLRALDEAGVAVIVCPLPEGDGIGVALRDRLKKAARAK